MASSGRNSRKGAAPSGPPSLSPSARRRILGVLLVVLGAASALSLLFAQGGLAGGLSWLVRQAAGYGAMGIPVALLWSGGLLLRAEMDAEFVLRRWRVAGGTLLLLSFLGVLQLLPVGDPDPVVRAAAGHGGGQIGNLLGLPLVQNLGAVGALLALLVALLVGAGLTFEIRPRQVWGLLLGGWNLILAGWDRFRQWGEQRRQRALLGEAQAAGAKLAEKKPSRAQPVGGGKREGARRGEWVLPSIDLFTPLPASEISQVDVRQRIRTIEETLRSFGVDARVVEVNQGPAVTQFGVEPGVGVKVARIMALGNDLALRLAAAPLRLEAPVPGKQVVGIEVPNGSVSMVCLRELLESAAYEKSKGRLKLALGRDVSGSATVGDLAKMPHLLIAGSTGSGKSVCLNSFIAALLYQCTPDDLRLLMVDPKMVEMMPFNGIPHLLTPVVTEMDKVVPSLKWIVREMERRYRLFAARGARNIEGFNKMVTGKGSDLPLPYIVVIIDELADLMMVAPDEVEKIICRLAQLARATGIHLVVATQRPSVDVITGLIKANFPTRISFAVTSQIDSRVILDQAGAEKLLGRGDMLYMPPDSAKPVRLQGTYVSDGEIQDLVEYWKRAKPPEFVSEEMAGGEDAMTFEPVEEEEVDDLLEQAIEVVGEHTKVSTSLLQRKLRIGYNRAARLMEEMEDQGIVGPSEGGKSREVLLRTEESAGDEEDPEAEREG